MLFRSPAAQAGRQWLLPAHRGAGCISSSSCAGESKAVVSLLKQLERLGSRHGRLLLTAHQVWVCMSRSPAANPSTVWRQRQCCCPVPQAADQTLQVAAACISIMGCVNARSRFCSCRPSLGTPQSEEVLGSLSDGWIKPPAACCTLSVLQEVQLNGKLLQCAHALPEAPPAPRWASAYNKPRCTSLARHQAALSGMSPPEVMRPRPKPPEHTASLKPYLNGFEGVIPIDPLICQAARHQRRRGCLLCLLC